jgi:TIR domain-containing protein
LREGILVKWYDREIRAGQEWNPLIKKKLLSSHIILLLVSPDFMESRYCYNLEMKEALARHEKGQAVVIPVILRPCLWQDTPIGKLQALPKDGKPITNWSKIDDATLNVASGIVEVVRRLIAENKVQID